MVRTLSFLFRPYLTYSSRQFPCIRSYPRMCSNSFVSHFQKVLVRFTQGKLCGMFTPSLFHQIISTNFEWSTKTPGELYISDKTKKDEQERGSDPWIDRPHTMVLPSDFIHISIFVRQNVQDAPVLDRGGVNVQLQRREQRLCHGRMRDQVVSNKSTDISEAKLFSYLEEYIVVRRSLFLNQLWDEWCRVRMIFNLRGYGALLIMSPHFVLHGNVQIKLVHRGRHFKRMDFWKVNPMTFPHGHKIVQGWSTSPIHPRRRPSIKKIVSLVSFQCRRWNDVSPVEHTSQKKMFPHLLSSKVWDVGRGNEIHTHAQRRS